MSKDDGLLEWVDNADGSRVATVKAGNSFGMIEIKHVKCDTWKVEVRMQLAAGSGGRQAHYILEEAAQRWIEAVGGEPA